MVQIVLQMEEPPGSSDAADALAVALCHVNASRANQLIILD
jgi:Holliday junction resolvasome RuvABC endonuclease subunit